ncbi:MAG: efflux RND transporter periplasmic adaptor subunit, partial [Pseudomonadales bacterium]|nr:efflux RND transporter periplasmic adaptor subunit [Pseudomonadales bacterium]
CGRIRKKSFMLGTKKNRYLLTGVIVVGLLITWLIATSKPAPAAKPIRLPPVPIVDVLHIQPGNHRVWIETQGLVKPKTQIQLVSQVTGRVEAIADQFSAGGFFAANEVLVMVEESDYRIAVSQASAQLANAKQLLATEKGRARQAKREWRDLGNSEANDLFLRKPQLASAKANLLAAEAGLEKAELDLSRTRVSAPFAGRVLSKRVDVGQFVSQGTPIAEIYSSGIAEVRLPLTAQQRQNVSVSGSQPSPVKLIARYGNNDYEWDAVLDRLEGAIDSSSRQYYVVASLPQAFADHIDETGALQKPGLAVGQFVTAQIAGSYIDNSFLIPRSALRQQQKIWVLENNRLAYIDVVVIQSNDDTALVQLADKSEAHSSIAVITTSLSLALKGMEIRDRSVMLLDLPEKQADVTATQVSPE